MQDSVDRCGRTLADPIAYGGIREFGTTVDLHEVRSPPTYFDARLDRMVLVDFPDLRGKTAMVLPHFLSVLHEDSRALSDHAALFFTC